MGSNPTVLDCVLEQDSFAPLIWLCSNVAEKLLTRNFNHETHFDGEIVILDGIKQRFHMRGSRNFHERGFNENDNFWSRTRGGPTPKKS